MDSKQYKCGCEASGDNVASYCPMHGDPEVWTQEEIDAAKARAKEFSKLIGWGSQMDSKQVREKIAFYTAGITQEEELSNADAILALPELEEHFMGKPGGLVVKSKCSENNALDIHLMGCRGGCNGSRFISRQLTVREALEILRTWVKVDMPQVFLPSGEKVEVEK